MRSLFLVALGLAIAALWPIGVGARPEPREGGMEIGGAAFVGAQNDNGKDRISAGPLLHVAMRGGISEDLALALVARFGLGTSKAGNGAIGSLAFEVRAFVGDDLAPFGLLGLGVLFQQVTSEDGLRLVSQPRPVVPLGLGIESRLTDSLILGLAVRYTLVVTDISATLGPLDLSLVFIFI